MKPLAVLLLAPLIVIDPGHGVINYQGEIINSGKATRSGVQENKLTFQICQQIRDQLIREGFRVVLTRTEDTYWREAYIPGEDNKNRALFANELKADAFISIHCDWHPKARTNGITTFYKTKESRALGASVHTSLLKELKAHNRNLVREEFTVLDHARMPAILVETGFLSHWREGKKLAGSDYQNKIAKGISDGLVRYFSETAR